MSHRDIIVKGEAAGFLVMIEGGMKSGREKMDTLRRAADRVSVLIVSTDYPEVDILLERAKLRDLCEELFPGSSEWFDMIYEARFDRLWQQFRAQDPTDNAPD